MSNGIRVGLLSEPLRIVAIILLVLAGRAFNAKAQGLTNQIYGIQVAGTNVAISVQSVFEYTYQLQSTTSMTTGNWSNVVGASLSNSAGGLIILTNFGGASAPQTFYRLDITPSLCKTGVNTSSCSAMERAGCIKLSNGQYDCNDLAYNWLLNVGPNGTGCNLSSVPGGNCNSLRALLE
jgi:hypothetical protein